MKAISLLLGVVLLAAGGCESSSKTAANDKRADVMDLNDTPKPAARTPIAEEAASVLAPSPSASEPAAAGPRKHVVAAKETLYSLAQKYYGDGRQYPKIVAANPGLIAEKMPVGKTIVIP